MQFISDYPEGYVKPSEQSINCGPENGMVSGPGEDSGNDAADSEPASNMTPATTVIVVIHSPYGTRPPATCQGVPK